MGGKLSTVIVAFTFFVGSFVFRAFGSWKVWSVSFRGVSGSVSDACSPSVSGLGPWRLSVVVASRGVSYFGTNLVGLPAFGISLMCLGASSVLSVSALWFSNSLMSLY